MRRSAQQAVHGINKTWSLLPAAERGAGRAAGIVVSQGSRFNAASATALATRAESAFCGVWECRRATNGLFSVGPLRSFGLQAQQAGEAAQEVEVKLEEVSSAPGEHAGPAAGVVEGKEESKGKNTEEDDGCSLESLPLSSAVKGRLQQVGISRLFPVQAQTFHALIEGKDMVVRAKTGSGKTIGFALPVTHRLTQQPNKERGRAPRAIVLAPTRELALQIYKEFQRIAPELVTTAVYGGSPYFAQEKAFRDGVDVVVGTPGRLLDHLEQGKLNLSKIEFFILDEADEMLKMGFQNAVESILDEAPAQRQMNLWSATMPPWVKKLSKQYCKDLVHVDMVGEDSMRTADTIRHVAMAYTFQDRPAFIADTVRLYGKGGRVLVFAQTKAEVDTLVSSAELCTSSRAIHGDVAQSQRERTLMDFRKGDFSVLVATDVAARGLDVPEVELVIQASMPLDNDTFVHRSGRTGRAGRSGVNVVMYKHREEKELLGLANEVGISFAMEGAPRMKDVLAERLKDATVQLEKVPNSSVDKLMRSAAQVREELGDKALAAALAILAGFGRGPPSPYSILTGKADMVCLQMHLPDKLVDRVRTIGAMRGQLGRKFPDVNVQFGAILKLNKGFLFELPYEDVHLLLGQDWEEEQEAHDVAMREAIKQSQSSMLLWAPCELPQLKEMVSALQSRYDGPGGNSRDRGFRGDRSYSRPQQNGRGRRDDYRGGRDDYRGGRDGWGGQGRGGGSGWRDQGRDGRDGRDGRGGNGWRSSNQGRRY